MTLLNKIIVPADAGQFFLYEPTILLRSFKSCPNKNKMQEEFKKIEETADHLRQYFNTRIDQVKLSAAEKASDVISVFIAKAIVVIIFFFAILFAGNAAAYFIGGYLGNVWLGFLVVSGVCLLLALIIWIAKERLLRIPIMNAMISRLFMNETKDDGKN